MARRFPAFVLILVLGPACSGPASRPLPATVEAPVQPAPEPTDPSSDGTSDGAIRIQEPPDVEASAPGTDPAPPVPAPETGPVEPLVKADLVVVESDRSVLVMYRESREIARFPVALGRGGIGKRRRGDEMTPRGRYRLLAPAPSRRFHHFVPVTYPNASDLRRGLARGFLTQAEHDRLAASVRGGGLAPQDSKLGGNVGIHAPEAPQHVPRSVADREHQALEKTGGCIVMRDADLEAFLERFEPGVAIEIR